MVSFVDIRICNDGSMVGFIPVSDAGKRWLNDNVASEDWQWLGCTLWVDQRFAGDLIEGMVIGGLAVA